MFNKKIIIDKMNRIRNKLHKTETSEVCKVSLPCFDDKRYILDDDIIVSLIFIKIYGENKSN